MSLSAPYDISGVLPKQYLAQYLSRSMVAARPTMFKSDAKGH
jgi:hypothetical protein